MMKLRKRAGCRRELERFQPWVNEKHKQVIEGRYGPPLPLRGDKFIELVPQHGVAKGPSVIERAKAQEMVHSLSNDA